MGFSMTHLLILLVVVLIFFGPGRLPNLGKSIGEAIRGFKKGLDEEENATTVKSETPQQIPASPLRREVKEEKA